MNGARQLATRVVVTGLGAVSCCGIGKDAFWDAVRNGVSGIRQIQSFDVSDLPAKIGGEVRNFDPTDYMEAKEARKQGRFVHYAVAAAKLAMLDSGLNLQRVDPYEVGVAFGSSGAGNGNIADDDYRLFVEGGLRAVDPNAIVEVPAHASTSHIAIELGLKGPNMSASTGCVTSIVTIAQAFEAVRSGAAQCMIAGGTEACLSRFIYGLLCRLRVLSTQNLEPDKACKPFDKARDGLVLAEGAGALMLENAEHAMNRGAHIYAEILGYGITSEAYHMVIAVPTGEELARAIKTALRMARISPTDLDYACAHGIGNKDYDIADTRALKLALGNHAYHMPVSSIKPVMGQPFAASAALQAVAVCMAIAHDTAPPTLNHQTPDEECDLDYVPYVARRARIDTALLNAHSFGGTHAALVLRRFAA